MSNKEAVQVVSLQTLWGRTFVLASPKWLIHSHTIAQDMSVMMPYLCFKNTQVSKFHPRRECIVQAKEFYNFPSVWKRWQQNLSLAVSMWIFWPNSNAFSETMELIWRGGVGFLIWGGGGGREEGLLMPQWGDRVKEVLLSFGRATVGEDSVCNISTCGCYICWIRTGFPYNIQQLNA